MKKVIILFMLILCSSVLAQDRTVMNQHKFYDTTKVEDFKKIKRRRGTIDVDSTGISIFAWGDECFFKVNLLQRMLINANFYETGVYNNAPYMRYGNDNFRFRMYINDDGRFEFDAKIRNKSPIGRHELPFNIETQNLDFFYQEIFTQSEMDSMGLARPDNVQGSYAVYHSSKRNNYTRSDGTVEVYNAGKAFHIYRPLVWDNAGDTVWGTIRIDTLIGRMFFGVDSTWLANAVHPVVIDPTIGYTTLGSSGQSLGTDVIYGEIPALTETIILDSVYVGADGGATSWVAALYDDDGSGNAGDLLASMNPADSVSPDPPSGSFIGRLITGTITSTNILYPAARLSTGAGAFYVDIGGFNWDKEAQASSHPNWDDPATNLMRGDSRWVSIYYVYHTEAGGDAFRFRRRNLILQGEYSEKATFYGAVPDMLW